MKELPESDVDIAQWCKDRFVAKVWTFLFLLQNLYVFGIQNIKATCIGRVSYGNYKLLFLEYIKVILPHFT